MSTHSEFAKMLCNLAMPFSYTLTLVTKHDEVNKVKK